MIDDNVSTVTQQRMLDLLDKHLVLSQHERVQPTGIRWLLETLHIVRKRYRLTSHLSPATKSLRVVRYSKLTLPR